MALARSRRKLGYDRTREGSYRVLTERVAPFDREAHAVLRYLNLAHHLGAPVQPPRFRLGLDAEVEVGHLLPGEARGGLVVLHPGARWPSKLWPAAAWAQLGDWLVREHGLRVALTGSAADQRLAADILAEMQEPALSLAGRTTLAGTGCGAAPRPLDGDHRHRRHAPGRGPGDAGGGPLRPHRALAHRAFRRRAPGCAPGPGLQPLLSAPLP